MNQSVQWLNRLPAARARAELLKSCGSRNWARQMTEARPFQNLDEVLEKAGNIWRSLREEDWLEAFRTHPKIGEKKAADVQPAEARKWSAQEQSGIEGAAAETTAALADGNREYERRFGFIFIVCASGKTSEEMLTILRHRLQNDRETELIGAAEEQRKITTLRLQKLLN